MLEFAFPLDAKVSYKAVGFAMIIIQLLPGHPESEVRESECCTDRQRHGGRKVLKSEMPQISLSLCLFHVLRTFKREITMEKMGLTNEERNAALEILQRLTYSTSEEKYNEIYKELKELELTKVTAYFEKNWHGIREEWVEGLKKQHLSLGERTTNRVESTFQKIKSVTASSMPLKEFLKTLWRTINTLRTERRHRAMVALSKIPRNQLNLDGEAAKYAAFVTPYAYQKIQRNIKSMERVDLTATEDNYTANSSEGIIQVKTDSCSCSTWTSLHLPCKHVLAARQLEGIPIYDEDLVSQRWTRTTYRKTIENIAETPAARERTMATPIRRIDTPTTATKTKTHNGKFKEAQRVGNKIASMMAEVGTDEYRSRLAVLNKLAALWEEGKTATVVEVIQAQPQRVPAARTLIDIVEDAPEIEGTGDLLGIARLDCETRTETDNNSGKNNSEDTISKQAENTTVEEMTTQETDNFNLTLPPKMNTRGRPKGKQLTAIGLKRKRATTKEPVRFEEKTTTEKHRMLLECLVSIEDADSALKGQLLGESSVETIPEKISTAVLEDAVDMSTLRRYFDGDAWLCVQQVLTEKEGRPCWICDVCEDDLALHDLICCDACLHWSHLKCLGKCRAPKSTYWYCSACKK